MLGQINSLSKKSNVSKLLIKLLKINVTKKIKKCKINLINY